jgi:uncharacterized protein YndB with AHSA1/START domain
MGRQSRGFVHRVDIRADLPEVWQALIDPKVLAQWHVSDARIDAREGGSYSTRLAPNLSREAHIDIFQPPRRLRLIYMPLPGLPDDGAVVVDDFLLDQGPLSGPEHRPSPTTVLRLMGSGFPEGREWDAMYMRLRGGWERALLRLKASFEPSEHSLERTRRGAAPKARPPVAEDQMIDWPPPTSKGSQPTDDFIPWPEPPPKKR